MNVNLHVPRHSFPSSVAVGVANTGGLDTVTQTPDSVPIQVVDLSQLGPSKQNHFFDRYRDFCPFHKEGSQKLDRNNTKHECNGFVVEVGDAKDSTPPTPNMEDDSRLPASALVRTNSSKSCRIDETIAGRFRTSPVAIRNQERRANCFQRRKGISSWASSTKPSPIR